MSETTAPAVAADDPAQALPPADRPREKDRPWVMRTYAGHSSAATSNALYRRNLAKGQTGLSVAFDLPTQTGYDPDDPLAARRGRQGRRAGRAPRRHARAVRRHPARRDEHLDDDQRHRRCGCSRCTSRSPRSRARDRDASWPGTTQNDIVKEYLSRGTYIFPPEPSLRLITDMIAYTVNHIPKWNPINICSYHLQEAGRDAGAGARVRAVRRRSPCSTRCATPARSPADEFGEVVGRISFFVNAGMRFVEEMCKMRAFVGLWDEITRERYGVTDAKRAASATACR